MDIAIKMCELLNNLGYHIAYAELMMNDIDLRDFIMDSFEFVSLIVEIETTFSVELPDEFLEFDVLASMQGMINAIEVLVNQSAGKRVEERI